MSKDKTGYKIKVSENGPYIVTGNVPLHEKIIVKKGKGYEYKDGRDLPQAEEYYLCRCGKSKNAPFCDGTHAVTNFVGTEIASRIKYEDRADLLQGPGIDLLDDDRCAFARFCHSDKGNTWDLLEHSNRSEYREKVIKTASDCPTGRLTAIDKAGRAIEPEYEPSIDIIQDPEEGVSAGIFVKGYIPIEAADGEQYEVRNRVTLCRCGKSYNKPFCDATHVVTEYVDE